MKIKNYDEITFINFCLYQTAFRIATGQAWRAAKNTHDFVLSDFYLKVDNVARQVYIGEYDFPDTKDYGEFFDSLFNKFWHDSIVTFGGKDY